MQKENLMSNQHSQQLKTVWKYTRFIFKNTKAFRASRKLYEVRVNLSLANMEIGKLTYRDPIYAQRVKEFNRVMLELVQGKWLAACAMEAEDSKNMNNHMTDPMAAWQAVRS